MEGITFWVSSCVEEMITMPAQLNRSLRCVIFFICSDTLGDFLGLIPSIYEICQGSRQD